MINRTGGGRRFADVLDGGLADVVPLVIAC